MSSVLNRQSGGQDQHICRDLLVAAGIAITEPQIVVLDLPAARNLLESGDLREAAQFDRRIAARVQQMVDDALVQRLARAGEAAQETAPLAFAIGFLVQRGLRVGILDDGKVQRSPILDGIVLAGEGCVGLERRTRLLQISRPAEICERLVIAGRSGEIAARELNRKFGYHLAGFTAVGRHEVLGAVVVRFRKLERPVLHHLRFSAIEVRPDRDVGVNQRPAANTAGGENIELVEHVVPHEWLGRIGEIAPVAANNIAPGGIQQVEDAASMIGTRPILHRVFRIRILRPITRRILGVIVGRKRLGERALGAEPPHATFKHENLAACPWCSESERRGCWRQHWRQNPSRLRWRENRLAWRNPLTYAGCVLSMVS